MNIIDERGRLFGRLNVVDAAIIGFCLLLLPLAYGSYLLFRPTRPQIDRVARAEIGREELRVSNGSALTAKFKVSGTGFTPLLRARIGGVDALGFVFESPNSADILVGAVPSGRHDLVLLDGVQEVARAIGAIEIQDSTGTPYRVAGWLIDMAPGASNGLKAGSRAPEGSPTAFEVVALGPERPGRLRLRFGAALAERPAPGLVEREAVLTLQCDSPPVYETCSFGGQVLTDGRPVTVTLPGPFRFEIHDVLPAVAATPATLTMRLMGPGAALLRVGDRDNLFDERAAQVTAIGARDGNSAVVTLTAGVDASREGWRYRGVVVRPGGTLGFTTDRYEVSGQVLTLATPPAGGATP